MSGEVRLYYAHYSPSSYSGLVEVFLSDEWGAVNSSWTVDNAEVVCRQLGFEVPSKMCTYSMVPWLSYVVSLFFEGIAISTYSYYSLRNRVIPSVHISDVQCLGNESRLIDCPHNFGGSGEYLATQRCPYYLSCKC